MTQSSGKQTYIAAFFLGALTSSIMLSVLLYTEGFPFIGTFGEHIQSAVVVEEAYTLDASEPHSLTIPAINLEVPFSQPLGVDQQREIEIPKEYDRVGWYKHGPTPGELGPAVVLGHVDSFAGPAVFFDLEDLKKDDEIYITREDGKVATFKVTELAEYTQEGFPAELVYGDIDHAGLRLVTCSGFFDHGIQRYSHNVVVYAELVEPASLDNVHANDA